MSELHPDDVQDDRDVPGDGDVGGDLGRLIQLLVEDPEAVRLGESRHRDGILFQVRLPSRELGKVIGRQGRTARALRGVLAARGDHDGHRYGLEIRKA